MKHEQPQSEISSSRPDMNIAQRAIFNAGLRHARNQDQNVDTTKISTERLMTLGQRRARRAGVFAAGIALTTGGLSAVALNGIDREAQFHDKQQHSDVPQSDRIATDSGSSANENLIMPVPTSIEVTGQSETQSVIVHIGN